MVPIQGRKSLTIMPGCPIRSTAVRRDSENSELSDQLARPHLLRFFADGWSAFLVPECLPEEPPKSDDTAGGRLRRWLGRERPTVPSEYRDTVAPRSISFDAHRSNDRCRTRVAGAVNRDVALKLWPQLSVTGMRTMTLQDKFSRAGLRLRPGDLIGDCEGPISAISCALTQAEL
jgi:hypothetical protein